jgi:mannosyltransferase OCH1-like enzyme
MIPKVVYQTWKTKELPQSIQAIRETMINENPDYIFLLFDDAEMDKWMEDTMESPVVQAYNSLSVGAAKADLWRYCILYKNGGVYLDIDSKLLKPLSQLILDTDQAILSREGNPNMFLQWLLIFNRGHPILQYAINLAVANITHKVSTNISNLTGPKVFTYALHMALTEEEPSMLNLWEIPDKDLNNIFQSHSKVPCRFLGFDFVDPYIGTEYACWKSESADDLYATTPHWLSYATPFKNVVG